MSLKLLIVDDDPIAGKVLTTLGGQLGLDVTCIEKRDDIDLEEVTEYDTIALDLMMPGTDGIQWLRLLAQLGSSAKIILISGLNKRILKQSWIAARGYKLNVVATIQKPISKAKLKRALAESIQTSSRQNNSRIAHKIPNCRRIEKGLLTGEFDIVLQPQINLQTGTWCGNEVLARWHHSKLGALGPESFIDDIDAPSLQLQFTLVILEKSLSALSQLQSRLGFNGTIAVNVFPSSMAQLNFSDLVYDLLCSYDIDPRLLTLEITESAMTGSGSVLADVQARLGMRGVTFSIDDFGTGLSGIERLHRTPCDELKIDRQFVRDLITDREAQHIVQNMIQLAHDLDMQVVAEGIEDTAVKEWLTTQDCDIGQGFLFSKPLSISQLIEWGQAQREGQGL